MKTKKNIRILADKYKKLQTLMCYVNKEMLMEQHMKQMKGKASEVGREKSLYFFVTILLRKCHENVKKRYSLYCCTF